MSRISVSFDRQPATVAHWLIALNQAGCDGRHISFYDFREHLDLLSCEVLPLLHYAPDFAREVQRRSLLSGLLLTGRPTFSPISV
jgi:hypothetical protein